LNEYDLSNVEEEMPALLTRPENDEVDDELFEPATEMPELLFHYESSKSEDEVHDLKPKRKMVYRRAIIRR
jgi:hypothetical protein